MIRGIFSRKKGLKKTSMRKRFLGVLFAIMAIFSLNSGVLVGNTYANSVTTPTHIEATNTSNNSSNNSVLTNSNNNSGSASCEDNLGAIGWLVCPTTGVISKAVDFLYGLIEDILVINPVEIKDGSPIYEVWKYMLGVTNIVFVIFFLIVVISQVSGIGISNYGIKKVLPKLVVVAILVNLSFIICSLAVDVSNIFGAGMRDLFESVASSTSASMTSGMHVSMADLYGAMATGGALTVGAGVVAFEAGAIWMLIPTVLGAIVAVVVGLITIALRQAVVTLLIMIAPLAMVSYMLPNTESWFNKWKQLLIKMLVFYPLFSLLFGASSLAGWAIIASATNGFWVILGIAVQIFPLFFAVSLMKMSGTFLSTINSKLSSLTAKPLAANRAWADSRRQLTKQRHLAAGKAYTPSLKLMQYLSDRRIAREEETAEYATTVKNRGLAYTAMLNYKKDGTPSKEGEEAYEAQARNIGYSRVIARHKNNMNKGMGQLDAVQRSTDRAQKARLDALDMKTVEEADAAFTEAARGEMIERKNAEGRYKRFEAAMNAHMDDVNGYEIDATTGERIAKKDYKFHFDAKDKARLTAQTRYNSINSIMEGDVLDSQFAAASAAQAFDTQAKIVNTKFQKYFELVPPTQDLEYRLREFSRFASADPNFKVSNNMDTIIAGLRVINQRGDTDIVKSIIDDVVDKKYGGLELGTHASQSLASFLMFEVKDNDPFLRRFGKYINLETARAYNEGELKKDNNRREMNVTYDEYVKGYHIEPDGSKMFAKKDMKKLVEGTSLDNIERTALSNLDDSLKKAYGFDAENPTNKWDVDGWMKKRKEIQTAFEPAFLSASLKWLSGSEQINSAVKFWTGYDLKQKKDDEGKVMVDDKGEPIYELSPVWEGKEFAGHEKDVKDYFRDRTMAYFKDQTTGQILGMRTDYRDATMEHLIEEYLNGHSDDETSEERRRKYNETISEIQTRYADEAPEKAKEKRAKDLKDYRMSVAGKQVRKILGETGKLKQIYRTRTSGTAINAKDWLRGWVNLDNEDALREEMNYYDRLKKEKAEAEREKHKKAEDERKGADDAEESPTVGRIYTEDDRERFVNEMQDLKDRILDEEPIIFYEDTRAKLVEWFGEETEIVKKYEHFHDVDDPSADNIELYKFVKELLEDMNNYPDA